jgi:hypothetical protein
MNTKLLNLEESTIIGNSGANDSGSPYGYPLMQGGNSTSISNSKEV